MTIAACGGAQHAIVRAETARDAPRRALGESALTLDEEIEAALLASEACDMQSAASCAELAARYQYGRGVEQSEAIAARFFERACNGDHVSSCTWIIAKSLEPDSWRVAGSTAHASEVLARACGEGDADACATMRHTKSAVKKVP